MDIENKLQKSIDLYLNNFGIFFLTISIGTIISIISMGILAGPLIGGAMVLTLNLIRNKPATFREIFSHFDKFLPTTLISLPSLFFLLIIQKVPIIGVFLGIAFSPFILVIMAFAIVLIIEKNYPPLPALKEALTFIKTDPVIIWIYALIALILSAIGAVAFGIGALLTVPFSVICMTVAYQDYLGQRIS
ncbi:MAG: hypothetical protein GXY86_16865 [Firmicutes bacterium]|nr:hypothetical protein [Bacillota bacterium]